LLEDFPELGAICQEKRQSLPLPVRTVHSAILHLFRQVLLPQQKYRHATV